jgi:murein DD-endopeptidase MepM/ murein hydrolase activator NlpD
MFAILVAFTVASIDPTAPGPDDPSPPSLRPPGSLVRAAADAAAPPSVPELPSGLASPMPGGYLAGYPVDTGLDLAGIKKPVFSVAAGTVEYAEGGHTAWNAPRDSKYAVRIRLDEPIVFGDRRVTHVWYAHLHSLAFEQAEGEGPRRRVGKGQILGVSGVANGSWHLHLGMLLDGDVSQRWGSYLLEDEVRAVLAGPGAAPLRKGSRLPDFPPARRVAKKR